MHNEDTTRKVTLIVSRAVMKRIYIMGEGVASSLSSCGLALRGHLPLRWMVCLSFFRRATPFHTRVLIQWMCSGQHLLMPAPPKPDRARITGDNIRICVTHALTQT